MNFGENMEKRMDIPSKDDTYDPDKRVEFTQSCEINEDNTYDPDKRVIFPQNREATDDKKLDVDKSTEVLGSSEVTGEKIEISDPVREQIGKSMGTVDGLEELIEKHPEKKELWDSMRDTLDMLDNPEASAVEIKSAQGKISSIKGQIMEIATKDALTESGLDVEYTQRTVKGENGDTKPDVIAHNNTDKPIEALGTIIQPGERLSVECKCARAGYLTDQLNKHIPNQLSGHEGTSVLLTTSDIKDTPSGLAEKFCDRYNTKLVISDINVRQVENTIKEVFGK